MEEQDDSSWSDSKARDLFGSSSDELEWDMKVRPKKVKIRDSPMHVFTFFHVRLVRAPIISTVDSRSVLDREL